MVQVLKAKVVQAPRQIKSKYGYCTIVKVKLLNSNKEQVIFSKENDSNVLKRYVNEEVQVYQDANQKWRLIDIDSVKNVKGNGLQPISEVLERTDTNIPQNDLLSDVPMLSDLDKKKVAAFIKQQSKLLRYTVDVVKADFPDADERSVRSMAISLLINTNQMINRNL